MGLFARRKPSTDPAAAGSGTISPDDPEIPRYPPFLKGLPVAAPARILATQSELIAGLQDALAFTDARFAALVRPMVERYAAFVHLLPASEAHHHRGAGGLFRHGLEVAFHAARASQGRIFALDRDPAERRELEPRWRLATGLAGLCHDVGKPVSDLSVSDREGRTTWRPLLESLSGWAAANGVDRYFLRWRERRHTRHETFGLLVLERVLTPAVTAWLVDPDPEIMQGLLAAVAGIDDGAVLGTLVAEADRASVERDLRENHVDPAATSLGVPVDRYLLDAMRRLARGGKWQINVPGARLWLLAGGLHVVWPAGAEDIVGVLAADRVPGIPRDPDSLADILLERGLAVPRQAEGEDRRYWRLAPAPLARDGPVVTLTLLRLASPDLVLAGAPPAAVGLAVASGPPTPDRETEPRVASPTGEGREQITSRMEVGTSPAATEPASATTASGEGAGTRDPAESTADVPRVTTPAPQVPAANPHAEVEAREVTAGQGAGSDARPEDAITRAAAWLRAHGAGGQTLLTLAGTLSNDPSASEKRIRRTGAQLVVLFPEGLAGLRGTPQAGLDALAGDGLLDVNPLTPLRRVVEIDGRRGAPLTLEASRHLLALLRDDRAEPGQPDPTAPRPGATPRQAAAREAEPAKRTNESGNPGSSPPADPDPARALVERIRARDRSLAGRVSEQDGWLCVDRATVRSWAERQRIRPYALIRTLGHLPGCRVTPDGGLMVREEP